MDLPNVFRSSSFFMRTNDVLTVLVKDETGTAPIIGLVSEDNPDVPEAGTPLPPVIGEATGVLSASFIANWSASARATKYYLDVATDNTFTTFVSGFENKDVGNVITYPVTGLSVTTTYYYRVRAYSIIGTSKSSAFATTTTGDTVTDADGNTYEYVTIGTQQWFTSNLRTTKYADNTPIPHLSNNADWIAEDGTEDHDGAYCAYNNDPLNINTHGLLYNWYAVNNEHGLAPTGWRVPDETDLDTLSAFLGTSAGGKLKETGTTNWSSPNTGATNSYLFNGVPSGIRSAVSGAFSLLGEKCLLHSSTDDSGSIIHWELAYNADTFIKNDYPEEFGKTVRCMRDIP